MKKNIWKMLTVLMCLPVNSFAADKLIFAIDLIRHGDRTPTSPIPKVNYEWKQGLGQLTPTGMRQEFELGKAFRERYIEKNHLLPRHYQHGTMYVRSTDYERTLMSAQSLLMGMYPPGTGPDSRGETALPYAYQPIPIHSAPTNLDNIILHHIDGKERAILMQKYVYSTPEWQKKENALRPYFPRWSEATGFDIRTLDDLEVVGDALHIHQIHHIPMPTGLSDEDIALIREAGNFAFMAEEKPKEVAAAYSRQVISNIAGFLQKGSMQDSSLKYVLLSAHDSTIASALGVLSAPLDVAPPYASDLNFSLYESGASHYLVKVSYNGEPVNIPACGGSVCSLQRFVEIARGEK